MIYLDHASSTHMHKPVFDVLSKWMLPQNVGNPGSIHTQGVRAKEALETARASVAKLINADPSEIYFTSGGTESNNTMLHLVPPGRIITTRVEHDSILIPLQKINKYIPVYLILDSNGRVDLNALRVVLEVYQYQIDALCVMWVNNETGAINPISEIGEICRRYGIKLFTDAVQAAGHIPIDVKACNVDALSISGHKFGAPNIGALYVSKDIVAKTPLIYGGGQESGFRSGTPNVPGIAGLGVAAEIAMKSLPSWMKIWKDLRWAFIEYLNRNLPRPFYINGGSDCVSNIISLTIPGIESESLLYFLDQRDIYVSAGSACSAASREPSHVLTGIGLSADDAKSTIRISMGAATTASDLLSAAEGICDACKMIPYMF